MRLVVFFSRGMSLERWHRAGILERELALYRQLAPDLERLAFVTYGGADDQRYAPDLPGLDVLPNRWPVPANLYSVLAPFLHRRYLRAASVFRTNQINGGWCAAVARRLFAKPLIVRCGFLWADNVDRLTTNPLRRLVSRRLERMVFRSGDRIIVASAAHANAIHARYGIPPQKITVIPNYVDTTLFRPDPSVAREPGHVLFVGRLEAEKRIDSLIDAVSAIPHAKLTVVGDGSLRAALEQRARDARANVVFLGRVAHATLPALMARADVLALPSSYEGHPKVLVEAMASGLPVIGTRVAGIKDVIQDRVTGRLCGLESGDLRSALAELLSNTPLRQSLSRAALEYVHAECSLTTTVARERSVLSSLQAA